MHDGPIYSCGFNADGRYIATAGGDDSIAIISKVEQEGANGGLGEKDNNTQKANNVGERKASETTEDEAANGNESVSQNIDQWRVSARAIRAHSGDVNCVAWRPGSNTILASCGDDGLVRVWQFSEVSDDF